MFYVISAIVFGLLAHFTQSSANADLFSGLWWAIGAPFWALGGFVGLVMSNLIG